jgi:multimeric flavodoxin WrbA
MKVFAVNGSARKDGNTAMLIRHVFDVLGKQGIETEMIQLVGEIVRGCTVCLKCRENKDTRCAISNDIVNTCIQKMLEADAIILASPTYFSDLTPELKALIDRAGYVARGNDFMFSRKIGAAVSAVRRAGAIHVLDSINHFFFANDMIVPGSSYWALGIGRQIGEVDDDDEGIKTMIRLGENISWLLSKTKGKV